MFRRGQKVRIIESNAKKRAHPAIGDVGYLNNMFLFPKDRFILVNLFMCSYKKNDNRSERKNFILDIGMHGSTKNRISRIGVNKLFFTKEPHVNLNPTFFLKRRCTYTKRNYELLQAFPQLVGTYGIWAGYTSISTKCDRNNDSLFRIPCGNIAKCSEKRSRSQVDIKEFTSWLRSISAEIIPVLQFFNEFYPSNGGKLNNYAMSFWEDIRFSFKSEMQYDHIRYLRFKDKEFDEMTPITRLSLINTIMKIRNLTYMACERLTRHLINGRTSKGVRLQNLRNLLGKGQTDDLISPEFGYANGVQVIDAVFITKCLYRSLMMESDTSNRLQSMKKYLPLDKWDIDKMATNADGIKSDADSNSAALNRIFDLIKPSALLMGWADNRTFKTTAINAKPGMEVNITSNKLDRLGVGVNLTNDKIDMDKARTVGQAMHFEMDLSKSELGVVNQIVKEAQQYNNYDDEVYVYEDEAEEVSEDDEEECWDEEDDEYEEDNEPEEDNDGF